jgi:hypothetical protein
VPCDMMYHVPWPIVHGARRVTSPYLIDLRPPNHTPSTGSPPSRELLVSDTSRDGRAGGAPLTPRRAPGAPKCASRPCNDTQESGDSKKFLVLFLWRFKLGSCLSYLLRTTTTARQLGLMEISINHLWAGAFEITSQVLPFERVAAAMAKTIFDMGFVIADVRPSQQPRNQPTPTPGPRAVQSPPFPPRAARRLGGPGGGLGTPGLAPGPRPPRPHLRKK